MKKIKLLALALSVLGFAAPSVMAETVNFSGTYPADACQFTGASQGGTMGVSLSSPLIWGTNVTGGQPATIALSYLGQPTVTVDAVSGFNVVAGPVPSGTTYSTRATMAYNGQLNGGAWWDTGTKSLQLSNSYSSDTLAVDLSVAFGGAPTAGNYTASTTVTCQ